MDRRSLIKAALLSVIASGAGAFIPGPQARTQDPAARQPAAAATISPAKMSQVATVSDRFQSYNVEMAEVIGGNFWKPYSRRDTSAPSAPSATFEIGKDPSLFEARPPIDLRNRRLRILAAALGPAYVRVSGTWANSSWFQDDAPAATAPEAFTGVLTRNQWAGMMDFARAVDAKVVTSFAISKGVRDQAGLWTPVEAQKILAYTKAVNGEIVAAELFNEPNVASMVAVPGLRRRGLCSDVAAFRTFIDSHAPGIKLVGPGSVGEGTNATPIPSVSMIGSEDLLRAEPQPRFTVFSYHFYGAVSERCQARVPSMGTTADQALSEAWLARTETVFDFYKPLRDRYAPGAPIWITETADAACGGNRWGATFLDSFRYPRPTFAGSPGGASTRSSTTRSRRASRSSRSRRFQPETKLLGGAALETIDGHGRPRRRLFASRSPSVRSVPSGSDRGGHATGDQHQQDCARLTDSPGSCRALHTLVTNRGVLRTPTERDASSAEGQ